MAVVRQAVALREEGREATILFSLSGHGLFDLTAYEAHLDGTLPDQPDPAREIATALTCPAIAIVNRNEDRLL